MQEPMSPVKPGDVKQGAGVPLPKRRKQVSGVMWAS